MATKQEIKKNIEEFFKLLEEERQEGTKPILLRDIIDIKKWISPYFLGNAMYESLREDVKDILVDIHSSKDIQEVIITGSLGVGKCLPYNTFIATDKGSIYIQELFQRFQRGEVFNVMSDKGVKRVSYVYNSGVKSCLRVKVSDGRYFEGSEEHKLIKVGSYFGLEWKQLKDLKVGDKVLLSLKENLFNEEDNSFDYYWYYITGFISSIDKSFKNVPYFIFQGSKDNLRGFISGVYDSCGYVDSNKFIEFVFNYEAYARDFGYILSLFGINFNIRQLAGTWRINIKDNRNLRLLLEVIKSIWDIKKSKLDKFETSEIKVNIDFISEQLKLYLEKIFKDYRFNIESEKLITLYLEVLNKSNALTFLSENELETFFGIFILRPDIFSYMLNNNAYIGVIESIESTGNKACYDIEVEEAHTFIQNGFITHNSTIAELSMLRVLYELSCYKNIPALFNLPAGISQLVLFYLSVSEKQAFRTGFTRMLNILDSSPYFLENLPRDKKLNSECRFLNTKEIAMFSGSDVGHFMGSDLFAILLDESNFLRSNVANAELSFQKAQNIYRESTNRRKNRFTINGKSYGMSYIVSSVDTESSFTESRLKLAKSDKTIKAYHITVLSAKKKEFINMPVFYVMKGWDMYEPFLLEEVSFDFLKVFYKAIGIKEEEITQEVIDKKAIPESAKDFFIEVPQIYYQSFKADLYGSLKEVAGVVLRKSGVFLYKPSILQEVYKVAEVEGLRHPFTSQVISVSTETKENELIQSFIPELFNKNENFVYYIHIDQSVVSDRTGIACSHPIYNAMGEIERVIVDFMIAVEPPQGRGEIDILKCREFIFWLRDEFGLNIGKVTADTFASREGKQQFLKESFNFEFRSVDRTDIPYLNFRKELHLGRLIFYYYKVFDEEIRNLIHYRDQKKVDHEVGRYKDVSDAVVGSVNLSFYESEEGRKNFFLPQQLEVIKEVNKPDLSLYYKNKGLLKDNLQYPKGFWEE